MVSAFGARPNASDNAAASCGRGLISRCVSASPAGLRAPCPGPCPLGVRTIRPPPLSPLLTRWAEGVVVARCEAESDSPAGRDSHSGGPRGAGARASVPAAASLLIYPPGTFLLSNRVPLESLGPRRFPRPLWGSWSAGSSAGYGVARTPLSGWRSSPRETASDDGHQHGTMRAQ
jgi:hypothetical protein